MYLDIQNIKSQVTMTMILDYYGIRLSKSGSNRLTGCCPIHNGDNPNAFHVDLDKNLFHCFTHCGGGSIFDFVMKQEKMTFYQAALKIYNTFAIRQHNRQNIPCRAKRNIQPLTLQYDHPYLLQRAIDPPLARFFHMGYCHSGMMKHRIAIPIIDFDANLVAYCGRAVQHNLLPKYLFPPQFNKASYLFNMHNIIPHSPNPVFIVEGFFDCIHIAALGFDAIALMGNSISQTQIELLKEIKRPYILMLDGDQAGRNAMAKAEKKLKQQHITFNSIYLNHVIEPEQLTRTDLETLLI